jgi:hypothetical protein
MNFHEATDLLSLITSSRREHRVPVACRSCGGPAHRERFNRWRPGEGWSRVELVRCASAEAPNPKHRCGRVAITVEAVDGPEAQP